MNAYRLTGFMERLNKDAQRRGILMQNQRVQHAEVDLAWLDENTDKIAVFYLLAYSPELNTDEYLDCDLRPGAHGGTTVRGKKAVKSKVLLHIPLLQWKPEWVQKYFNHPKIRYGAYPG